MSFTKADNPPPLSLITPFLTLDPPSDDGAHEPEIKAGDVLRRPSGWRVPNLTGWKQKAKRNHYLAATDSAGA